MKYLVNFFMLIFFPGNISCLEKKVKLIILSLLISLTCFPQNSIGFYDPFDFGAKGDGRTDDTKSIQAAINKCTETGGGKVYLHSGHFRSGTIYLKDNVALYIEVGATLHASDNVDDFPSTPSNHPSYLNGMVTLKAFIYAEDVNNISIMGRGMIDGNGDHWLEGPYGFPSFSKRPRIIHFRGCENITIRDIKLYNSASWVQSYQSCKNMVIDGITVDSRPNKDIEKTRFADARGRNNDGLDLVDCQQVRISNCFINSGDDAICLKSFSPDEVCRDITITNCVVSSNASGIKIGTETSGAFEDITIQNCVVYDTRGSAIGIMTVDGARIERITISGILMRNIKGAAIFIRLGNRHRSYRENAVINTSSLKEIIIENIQGTRISSEYGCSVSGIQNMPVENIVLRNINLEFEGSGKVADSYRQIPEREKNYPKGSIFGILPAYGFFIRHAKNITLENVRLSFAQEDQRPALLCDDVEQLEIKGLKASGTLNTPELIRLVNTRNVVISDSRPTSPVPVFLSIHGEESDDIVMMNNLLKNAKQKIVFEKESMKRILTEICNIN
ncbi:MAG: glycoside hydrolase family 28 protein [Bacteroidales bacterium]|nr:glycoside hydrolase family 28 protein [Bacteroidales bacterium]